jgi:hypothetical protein
METASMNTTGVTADIPIHNTAGISYSKEEMHDRLKMARLEGYEKGYRAGTEEMGKQKFLEGFEKGREVGKTERKLLKNEETAIRVDATTQTTVTSTVDVDTQTVPYDDTPTSPPTTPSPAASPLTTHAQPPSVLPSTCQRCRQRPPQHPPQLQNHPQHLAYDGILCQTDLQHST